MNTQTMSLKELEQTGLAVLARELGPVGMIRFLQLFETSTMSPFEIPSFSASLSFIQSTFTGICSNSMGLLTVWPCV